MPHYFFDIKDGHRLVDPAGSNCKNDTAAIEKARVLAIGVSLDKPAVDPYSSGVGRLVELQVSGEDLALRLALRSVDAGRGSGRG
jgi:hypothetical protein